MSENRFDANANQWDKPDRIKLATAVHDAIKARVTLKGTERLVDFGCGTGLLSLPFAPHITHLAGIDTSQGMLAEMEKKSASAGLGNVSTHNCDLLEDNCPVGEADVVVSSMTFHHVKDIDTLVKKIRGLLVPGGYLAVADLESEDGDFHAPGSDFIHKGFSPQELAAIVERNGFSVTSAETVITMERERQGIMKKFPIFLLVAKKN